MSDGNGTQLEVDPNDLWIRRSSTDPVRVALPGEPMKCVAVKANGSRQCRAWANLGSNVCRVHGASTQRAKKAAARRLEEVRTFGALFARVEHAADTDPIGALMDELARSSVIVEGLAILTGDLGLGPDEDNDGTTLIGADRQANPLVKLLNEERDRKARFAQMAISAGVAERMVRVHERQASMLVAIIATVLDDPALNLTTELRAMLRRAFANQMRALPAGPS